LKGITEISKIYTEQGIKDYSNKAFDFLYENSQKILTTVNRKNEPYKYIYEALLDYIENLLIQKNFEQMLNDLLKIINDISPIKDQNLNPENLIGKELNVDNILIFYNKLLVACICLEDKNRFYKNYKRAKELKIDSSHEIILDSLRDIFNSCLKGDEKNFNKNLIFLSSILKIAEVKELRGIMKKYSKLNLNEIIEESNEKLLENNNEREKIDIKICEKDFEKITSESKIELLNLNKQIQNVNKEFNASQENLNQLSDNCKNMMNTSEDLIHRNTEEISHFDGKENRRLNKYIGEKEIKYDDNNKNDKIFIINLD